MPNRWAELRGSLKNAQRRAITQAAIRLLDERGVAAISMTALADEAGVSRQTLYNYFSSVEEAIVAYLVDEVALAEEAISNRLAAETDPLDRLRAFTAESVHRFTRRDVQVTMEAAMSPEARRVLRAALQGIQDLLEGVLREGIELGRFAPDLDPSATAQMLFCMIGGTAALVRGGADPDHVADQCFTLLRQAVLAPRS